MALRRNAATTLVALLAGGVLLLRAEPARSIQWIPVVANGDSAPDLPDGMQLREIDLIAVDGSGIIFQGGTGYPSYTSAIYRREPGLDIQPIASFEAETVMLSGLLFDVTALARCTIGNQSFFSTRRAASLQACPDFVESGQAASFLIDSNGAAAPIAAPGAPVPGRPGWIFADGWACDASSWDGAAINVQGDLAFIARVQYRTACEADPEPFTTQAIFAADAAGETTTIALPGDPAPGAGAASFFQEIWGPVEMSDRGEVAFVAVVYVASTGERVRALYRWSRAGGLQIVALGGAGVGYLAWTFHLGAGGHLAFLQGQSLYADDASAGVRLIVSPGDPAPGMPAGFLFSGVHRPPSSIGTPYDFAVNGVGDVAFAALSAPDPFGPRVTDTWGVWSPDATGALQLRLAEGQPAPSLAGLIIVRPEISTGLVLNDQGSLLVMAQLGAPDGTKLPAFAWYLIDVAGNVRFLLRDTHQPLDFAPGDQRLARIFELRSDASLRHFAFEAYSAAQTGIFRGVVPEPASGITAMAALVSLGVLRARRRR